MNGTAHELNITPHVMESSSNRIPQKLRHAQSLFRRRPTKVEVDSNHRRRWSHYDNLPNGVHPPYGTDNVDPSASLKSGYSTEQTLASLNRGRSTRNNLTFASNELKATLPSLDEHRLSQRSSQDVGVPVGTNLESSNRASGNSNFPLIPQKSVRRYYSNGTARRLDLGRSGSPSSRFSKTSEVTAADPARFADENDDAATPITFSNRFADSDFEPGSTSRFSERSETARKRNSLSFQARMKPMSPREVSNNGQPKRASQITEPGSSFSTAVENEANYSPLGPTFSGNSVGYAPKEHAYETQSPSGVLTPSRHSNIPAWHQDTGHMYAPMQNRQRPLFTDLDYPGDDMQASDSFMDIHESRVDDSDSERSYRRVRDQYLQKPRAKSSRYSAMSNTASQVTPRASQANLNVHSNQRPASHYYEKLHINNPKNSSFQALPYETTAPAKRPMPVTQPEQAAPSKKQKGFLKKFVHKISRIFK
ncbi:cell cortex node protein Slf1 [Schizosaccharomyces osmophilus]|uniref:Cell cortex node protein Slf1 n=1 Tax=Schizosaccharomyces osmophilus TaxID=2545709 RepID=A0AAE9W9N7_9SCHI|nr:cell cortex node protein Slf1 [Schizosaccharomyces osmophilus]WBW71361.1 cell cortex node protein Slf1 [Schizosaccharomyces osmophilus]